MHMKDLYKVTSEIRNYVINSWIIPGLSEHSEGQGNAPIIKSLAHVLKGAEYSLQHMTQFLVQKLSAIMLNNIYW